MIADLFITHSVAKLEQMTGHIESCLDRLNEDQIWRRGSEPENSVGNLILHLCGNLGQWIGHYVAGRAKTPAIVRKSSPWMRIVPKQN